MTATSLVTLAALLLLCMAVPGSATADAPENLRFQGAIALLQGQPPADGDYSFLVEIYELAIGGDPLYTQTVLVPVAGGAYTITVFPTTQGELADMLAGAGSRFVQITVLEAPGEETVNEVLLPRQQLTSVPYALDAGNGVPIGAIILWDQNGPCPDGFEEAEEFRGLFARGADVSASLAGVPESAGQSCGTALDPECDALATAYDDVLTVDELAAHKHRSWGDDFTGWPFGEVGPADKTGSGSTDFSSNYYFKTGPTGNDDPHYHPFRTVLFCRRT